MKPTERYDQTMAIARRYQTSGEEAIKRALQVEKAILKELGIIWYNGEPGFPCWSHADLQGYFNSPREVLEALERQGLG